MKILLTGGSGFIGTNFVRFVLQHRPGYHITNLDALTYSGNPANLAAIAEQYPNRYRFVHGRIENRDLIDHLVADADAVVHMAAESHVDRSYLDARPFVHTNVLGTQTLLDAVRAADPHNDQRFVYVSTDEVYGSLPLNAAERRFTEDSPVRPNNPYAASKAASEMLVRAYHHTFGMNTCITNSCNNFGPYQFPEKIIPLFVTNLIQGQRVPLYGDGRNVRDWIHVDDHCEAVLMVLERGQAGHRYNVGGHNEHSNLELTRTILEIMGQGSQMIRWVADRPGHDRRYAVDATKIERTVGWQPTRSTWPEGLQQTVQWYVNNPEWWQHIKNGEYYRDLAE